MANKTHQGARAIARPIRLAPALTGDFGQYHPGGHRRVQRFGGAGHRNRHHRIAVLPDQPRQALAFRSDDHHQRTGGVQIVEAVSPSASSPTSCKPRPAQSFSVRLRSVARAMGIRAAAPALVRQATAVTEAERRCGINTP